MQWHILPPRNPEECCYRVKVEEQPVTGFLNVNNLFNNSGPITGGFSGSPGFLYPTPTYADIIGRYFTVGIRVSM